MNIKVKETYTPEYTKSIKFDYQGEEYVAEIYIGDTCSDYQMFKNGKRIDIPNWIKQEEENNTDFHFLSFIDELAWEFEDNLAREKVKV